MSLETGFAVPALPVLRNQDRGGGEDLPREKRAAGPIVELAGSLPRGLEHVAGDGGQQSLPSLDVLGQFLRRADGQTVGLSGLLDQQSRGALSPQLL